MTALLWIVFAWMVIGTVFSALRPVKDTVENVASVVATVINIGACITIALAAVYW